MLKRIISVLFVLGAAVFVLLFFVPSHKEILCCNGKCAENWESAVSRPTVLYSLGRLSKNGTAILTYQGKRVDALWISWMVKDSTQKIRISVKNHHVTKQYVFPDERTYLGTSAGDERRRWSSLNFEYIRIYHIDTMMLHWECAGCDSNDSLYMESGRSIVSDNFFGSCSELSRPASAGQ